MAQDFAFQKGLVPLGGGAHVFLSGDEGFGLANAGLVVSDDESLVVDTLYDVRHAREMLDEFGRHTATAPVRHVFNTHTDGDHFFGNQVFADDVEIITTEAARALMVQEHADLTAELLGGSSDPASNMHVLAPLAKPFHFNEVRVRPADTTFSGERALRVGKLDVELHELGPAHTVGDAVAFLPEHRVLFSGDLLTRGIVKVVWSGSIPNWIVALERIRAFGAKIVVPGHGPVLVDVEVDAAIDRGIAFWSDLHEQANRLYDQGVPAEDATALIDIAKYPEATVTLPIIVTAIYHERNPEIPFQSLTQALESISGQLAKAAAGPK